MSSILKALKKLENQGSDEHRTHSASHASRLRKMLPEPKRSGPSSLRPIVLLSGALVLIACLTILWIPGMSWITHRFSSQKSPAQTEQSAPASTLVAKGSTGSNPVFSDENPTPLKKPEKTGPMGLTDTKRQPSSQVSEPIRKDIKTPVQDSKEHPVIGPVTAKLPVSAQPVVSPRKTPIASPQKSGRKDLSAQTTVKPAGLEEKAPRETSLPQPEQSRKQPPKESGEQPWKQAETTPPPKRINQSALKLQAIVYSKVPEKRMAVINGQIIKEGGFFENYSVIRIDENNILLRRKGVTYTMEFGGR